MDFCFYVYSFMLFWLNLCLCIVWCMVPVEAKSENQIPWKWSYGQLWATMWVLAIGPGSSGRWASPLNHWTETQCIQKFYFHFLEQNYPKYHQLIISQDKRNIPHFPCASCHCHLGLWHRYEHLVYINNAYNSCVSSLNISALSCMT